jgi:hypothetical protein
MLFANNDTLGHLNVSETKVTSAGAVAFYEARKRRLEKAGQKETMTLYCDFPDAVEPYLPQWEMPGDAPPDSPPIEFEQPPGGQPAPPVEPAPDAERLPTAGQTPAETGQP